MCRVLLNNGKIASMSNRASVIITMSVETVETASMIRDRQDVLRDVVIKLPQQQRLLFMQLLQSTIEQEGIVSFMMGVRINL